MTTTKTIGSTGNVIHEIRDGETLVGYARKQGGGRWLPELVNGSYGPVKTSIKQCVAWVEWAR
jgi:hypothetical protein